MITVSVWSAYWPPVQVRIFMTQSSFVRLDGARIARGDSKVV
jgi:hypothetical protein